MLWKLSLVFWEPQWLHFWTWGASYVEGFTATPCSEKLITTHNVSLYTHPRRRRSQGVSSLRRQSLDTSTISCCGSFHCCSGSPNGCITEEANPATNCQILVLIVSETHSGVARSCLDRHGQSLTNPHSKARGTLAVTVKLATTVSQLIRDLDLDFTNVYMARPSWLIVRRCNFPPGMNKEWSYRVLFWFLHNFTSWHL